jgi:hypothetical protein
MMILIINEMIKENELKINEFFDFINKNLYKKNEILNYFSMNIDNENNILSRKNFFDTKSYYWDDLLKQINNIIDNTQQKENES